MATATMAMGRRQRIAFAIEVRIALLVSASGLTQEALAERVGVSRITLNQWVNGKTGLNAVHAVMLAEALGVTVGQLLGVEPPVRPNV